MNERLREIAIKAQVEHCISHVRLEEFANFILQDVLNTVQEYGDIQLKLWQERTTGMNYKPAAEAIAKRIRESYDVKDPNA